MTDDLQPPATFDQPGWKPRHRVDPMRPANPRVNEIRGHYLHEHNAPELTDDDSEGRTGPNLTAGLILVVLAAFLLGIAAVVLRGLGLL
jgi:hypothetical protein